MSEILNKYKRWKALLLPNREKELDFVLSQDNANTINIDGNLTTKCLVSFIDTRKDECIGENGSLVSSDEYVYENAISEETKLVDIGFTGIDNGLITYDKNIELKDFVDILTGSTFEITSDDTRFVLRHVNGNSQYYQYPCELVSDEIERFYSFNGGFLQGFFKLDGFDYQVLPNNIEDVWNLEFVIRPRTDYETSGNTLNSTHPENAGIFFYMGTRAENKFARFYGADIDVYPDRPDYSGICFDSCVENNKEQSDIKKNREFLFDFYHGEEEEYSCCESPCGCGGNKDELNVIATSSSGLTLCVSDLETSNGHRLDNNKYFDIYTDNGYLIYDHSEGGYTTKTWKRGDVLHLIQKRIVNHENLYLLMNHAEGGLTTETLEEYLERYTGYTGAVYDILKDIKDNAFALKVNSDGSVGYKYLIRDCDNENGYSVISENTLPYMVRDNEWSVINVMFKSLDGSVNECSNEQTRNRHMRIYLYVNGYLKLVSKELPIFDFRALDDYSGKQEGVPYNISLGGGTQGMAESMWTDNYTRPFCKVLPLEENFGGSFVGDIRSFKFYNCQMQFNEIKNNYLYEMAGYQPTGHTIQDDIIYYGFGTSATQIPYEGQQMKRNYNIRNRYVATSVYDDAHFYVVMSEKYRGSKPVEFTCGGAPMVMNKREEIIDGKLCIVYESGAIYALGTELSILSDNI